MPSNTVVRRGRPPRVTDHGDGAYEVTVKGRTYGFRRGGDGRLRPLGTPTRDEDYDYARQQVERAEATKVTA